MSHNSGSMDCYKISDTSFVPLMVKCSGNRLTVHLAPSSRSLKVQLYSTLTNPCCPKGFTGSTSLIDKIREDKITPSLSHNEEICIIAHSRERLKHALPKQEWMPSSLNWMSVQKIGFLTLSPLVLSQGTRNTWCVDLIVLTGAWKSNKSDR